MKNRRILFFLSIVEHEADRQTFIKNRTRTNPVGQPADSATPVSVNEHPAQTPPQSAVILQDGNIWVVPRHGGDMTFDSIVEARKYCDDNNLKIVQEQYS